MKLIYSKEVVRGIEKVYNIANQLELTLLIHLNNGGKNDDTIFII